MVDDPELDSLFATAPAKFIAARNAKRIRQEFLHANPGFKGDDLAVVCSQRHLREVRICLDKELRPLACGRDVHDRCRGEVVVRPVR
jgi:ribonuclease T2